MTKEKRVTLNITRERIRALTTAIDFLSNFDTDDDILKEDVKVLKDIRQMYYNKKINELEANSEVHGYNSSNELTCTIIQKNGLTEVKVYDKENNLLADLSSPSKTNLQLAKRKIKNLTVKLYKHNMGQWKWSVKKC